MKRDQYWSKPKKAKIERGAGDAWWYANVGGIEIHVDPDLSCGHLVIRLHRAELKKYLGKSSATANRKV